MPPMPTDPANWIALLQNMAANQAQLQALLMNQANAPQQLASFNNMNMIKFSDPTWFSGKLKDVDSFVKTIQSWISSSLGMLVTDFQMVTYFASWLGSCIPEKWFLCVHVMVQPCFPSSVHLHLPPSMSTHLCQCLPALHDYSEVYLQCTHATTLHLPSD